MCANVCMFLHVHMYENINVRAVCAVCMCVGYRSTQDVFVSSSLGIWSRSLTNPGVLMQPDWLPRELQGLCLSAVAYRSVLVYLDFIQVLDVPTHVPILVRQ